MTTPQSYDDNLNWRILSLRWQQRVRGIAKHFTDNGRYGYAAVVNPNDPNFIDFTFPPSGTDGTKTITIPLTVDKDNQEWDTYRQVSRMEDHIHAHIARVSPRITYMHTSLAFHLNNR